MTTASPTDLNLTAARIRRAARRTMGPAINEETAREDAAIVHDIIACVRQAYTIQPTHLCWCGDESAAIQTIQRIAVGISSKDHNDACREYEELALCLVDVEQLTGGSDIYEKCCASVAMLRTWTMSSLFEDESAEPRGCPAAGRRDNRRGDRLRGRHGR